MKQLSRYAAIDEYTLEELSHEYRDSDAKGRIRLLNKLYSGGDYVHTPFEIALMAVEDSNVEVRQWIARHGEGLDFPEGNLVELLRIDSDPFVRACLYENPAVGSRGLTETTMSESTIQQFRTAMHLEHLALMRNPGMGWPNELIQKIFDADDQTLGISLEQRKELIVAFLTNPEAVKQSRRPDTDFAEGYDWYASRKHFAASLEARCQVAQRLPAVAQRLPAPANNRPCVSEHRCPGQKRNCRCY